MLNKFINKGGKKLRYGYTTGSCATAAAKAATKMLLTQKPLKTVLIDTPKGWRLELNIHDIEISKDFVSCSVIKDSGDDPDITNGIKVFATVSLNESLKIIGGKGIGVVTKKGLSVAVGEPAINPVPRQMIINEVSKVLPENKAVLIKISVPNGEQIAQKTFNPNLGIVGGISIIGTSGIVEPMSQQALKESLALELNIQVESGNKALVFVPGNYGFSYALSLNVDSNKIIKTSNFIGFILDKAEEIGLQRILIIGHLGKLVKVAGGIFQTHSKYADARMEILAAYCASIGASSILTNEILNCNTTEQAVELIKDNKLTKVFNILANKVANRATKRTHDSLKIECIIFSQGFGELGRSANADNLLKEFKNAKS
ncbi:cobalamin biosynthesis protein CbiD [Clostridium sp. 'deep sea']|uniref:cobalt-precorrin-5B (C(1))-methyltransferase CbiD n=1 Tax=Clostridium sp. 'deep sea' TaxID=2779445 RepID=UPI0018964666|nr:cobalt-precorrin-5B (C(1))-methyltransferase CbiD [Clostridium sp. 'deep sea']QOR36735.1 cobalamin biosynthesis protein CbiD [Clostridium sp. 'deep sea']